MAGYVVLGYSSHGVMYILLDLRVKGYNIYV